MEIEELVAPTSSDINDLAEVLVDCVDNGASISFMAGLTLEEAANWWHQVLGDGHYTFAARDDSGRIVGAVRLQPSWAPNSTNRADVAKLLVRSSERGQGIASALMDRLEGRARQLGRVLLMLDTETGSPAEAMYAHWGWERIGVIEEFAYTPDGRLLATTIFVKRL